MWVHGLGSEEAIWFSLAHGVTTSVNGIIDLLMRPNSMGGSDWPAVPLLVRGVLLKSVEIIA